jgi:hypothetical protein
MYKSGEPRPSIIVSVDVAAEKAMLFDRIQHFYGDKETKPLSMQLNNVVHSPQAFVAYLVFDRALRDSGIRPPGE